MTDSPNIRPIPLIVALVGLLVLAGCGAEAPTYEPGTIIVTSAPPGAAISLDGDDTGQVTPYTFADQEPGSYLLSVYLADFVPDEEVKVIDLAPADTDSIHFKLSQTGFRITSPEGARILVDGSDTGKVVPAAVSGLDPGTVNISLEMEGFYIFPDQVPVVIDDGLITEIPDGTFTSRARKTVILEGFANTSCPPCPELTDNLVALTTKPEFSPDRVQFIEFAVSWPQLADPFFLANPEGNSERYTLYQVLEAPDLYLDGVQLENALDGPAMESAVRASLKDDPGFLVDVEADFSLSPVPAVVTLTALRDVDLTGYGIYVAIYEKEVVIDPPPGNNGQTHFHHVFRERDTTLPPLGNLTVGNPQQLNASLGSNEAGPDSYVVVAFVQHQTSLAVLQCGSTDLQVKERNNR